MNTKLSQETLFIILAIGEHELGMRAHGNAHRKSWWAAAQTQSRWQAMARGDSAEYEGKAEDVIAWLQWQFYDSLHSLICAPLK